MAEETPPPWWDGSWPSVNGNGSASHTDTEETLLAYDPRFLGTNDVRFNTAQNTIATSSTTSGHVDQLKCGSSDFSIATDNTGAFLTRPSATQEGLVQGPGIPGHNA
ncbi:hypothetical protein MTO96_042669, partial [Rhipicephalus appendiculatus]